MPSEGEPGRPTRIRRKSVRTTTLAPAEQETPLRSEPQAVELPAPLQPAPLIVAQSITPPPQPPKRSKLGWQIRDDLIKQCKQLALDKSLHDYEALEMLLEESLARRKEE